MEYQITEKQKESFEAIKNDPSVQKIVDNRLNKKTGNLELLIAIQGIPLGTAYLNQEGEVVDCYGNRMGE